MANRGQRWRIGALLLTLVGCPPAEPIVLEADADADADADTDTDTDADTDTDGPVDDGWEAEREVELRLNEVVPPTLQLDLDRDEVSDLFGPVADDILLLELDSTPLLTNALNSIKTACGTGWQLDQADPQHDCSLTPVGQGFSGPDGTWQTSAEYNLVRLLTMTPANSVVDGTSIEQIRAVADFLNLGGGFSTILAEALLIDRTEEFITTPEVVGSLQRNLLGSHPELPADGTLPITLGDALGDLSPLATRLGPVGTHPGVLDSAFPIFGEVFTEDFAMQVEVRSNLRVLDGVDLSAGKDFMSVVVDEEGPTFDDAVEIDFTDPDAFSITGIAPSPTVDLRFGIQESPLFVPACTGAGCQSNLPSNPTPGFVWDLEPWTLEYIVADAGRDKYGTLENSVSYFLLGFIWAATIDIGQGNDPAGWASFSVLLDIGAPPDEQYVWDLINEVVQVGIHDSPTATFAEGDANPAFTLTGVDVGLDGATVEDAVRPFLQQQSSEIAWYLLGNYKENSGPCDFYYRRNANGQPALFWTTPDVRPDGAPYAWTTTGFYVDEALTQPVSSDGAWVVQPGETVLYAADELGDTYRVRVIARPDDELTVLTSRKAP
jgi:hypothetical protein